MRPHFMASMMIHAMTQICSTIAFAHPTQDYPRYSNEGASASACIELRQQTENGRAQAKACMDMKVPNDDGQGGYGHQHHHHGGQYRPQNPPNLLPSCQVVFNNTYGYLIYGYRDGNPLQQQRGQSLLDLYLQAVSSGFCQVHPQARCEIKYFTTNPSGRSTVVTIGNDILQNRFETAIGVGLNATPAESRIFQDGNRRDLEILRSICRTVCQVRPDFSLPGLWKDDCY